MAEPAPRRGPAACRSEPNQKPRHTQSGADTSAATPSKSRNSQYGMRAWPTVKKVGARRPGRNRANTTTTFPRRRIFRSTGCELLRRDDPPQRPEVRDPRAEAAAGEEDDGVAGEDPGEPHRDHREQAASRIIPETVASSRSEASQASTPPGDEDDVLGHRQPEPAEQEDEEDEAVAKMEGVASQHGDQPFEHPRFPFPSNYPETGPPRHAPRRRVEPRGRRR